MTLWPFRSKGGEVVEMQLLRGSIVLRGSKSKTVSILLILFMFWISVVYGLCLVKTHNIWMFVKLGLLYIYIYIIDVIQIIMCVCTHVASVSF